MAIEKGLYSAPEGLDKELQEGLEGVEGMDTTELEIEIIDPEAVTLSDGSMEITLIPDLNESDLMGFEPMRSSRWDETPWGLTPCGLTPMGSDPMGYDPHGV